MADPTIRIAVYTNGDDAFIAWAPSAFMPGCRGFLLERARKTANGELIEEVENRLGFKKDKPTSGGHRPSSQWPFQRFNWSDHVVNSGDAVRYRVTALIDDGSGRPYQRGAASRWTRWTRWARLRPTVGGGFSCYFNRGIVLSQFVARYLLEHRLTPAAFKAQLKGSVDPAFRAFLEGDLGARLRKLLAAKGTTLHAALYELDDAPLEAALIALKPPVELVLANGSDKSGDGNAAARARLNAAGVVTIDRLLKSRGLGHNKFAVVTKAGTPSAVWTGSTNWTTTGLCTQINNALLISDKAVAALYRAQWERLAAASPPTLVPAGFPPALVAANDVANDVAVGPSRTTVWFTRTSDQRDMTALREIIAAAKESILFLMFQPGKQGLHLLAGQRANEPGMYVRGLVSTLGNEPGSTDLNVLDVSLVSSDRTFKPDHYTVVQPQGIDADLGPWIAEVTRRDFLTQIGHAIVHSKIMVIDALGDDPVVVTGSHNFSAPASEKNDENFVIVRGHKALAAAYASHVMAVYAHYRFRSYVREMRALGKTPWSFLNDDDAWLKRALVSKAQEIGYWA